jgi:fructose-bisphosphate aldolase class II
MPDESVEIDLQLLASLARAAATPLALHGGSGVVRAQLAAAISVGVRKVNISSRVGRALADGIRSELDAAAGPVDLRRYMGAGRAAVRGLGVEYMQLCGSAGHVVPAHATNELTQGLEEPE